MAITTPNMGIRIWDHLNDPYDHDQLADNWSKVDFHDHTPGRGLLIPAEGLDPSIKTDYGYAFSTYKTVIRKQGNTGGLTVGTYILPGSGDSATATVVAAASAGSGAYAYYLDPAEHTAGTRTTKYRIRAAVLVNAVAPAATYTVGLYPVATFGGASAAQPTIATLGTVVAGSTVAFATPSASTQTVTAGADFTAPSAGWYTLGVATTGGTEAANSISIIKAMLEMRQV